MRTKPATLAAALLLPLAWTLSLHGQQAGSSANSSTTATASEVSALMGRVNANASATTGRKTSSAGQRAPSAAAGSGGSSSWGAGKGSFSFANQPGGIWHAGSTLGTAPATEQPGISGLPPVKSVSLPASNPASEQFTPKTAAHAQAAGPRPAASGIPAGLKQGGGRSGPSSKMGGGLTRSAGVRPGSAQAGRGGVSKISGSRSGAPAFASRRPRSTTAAVGAKKAARGSAGHANRPGHAVGSGVNPFRTTESSGSKSDEIGTMPKTNLPDLQP